MKNERYYRAIQLNISVNWIKKNKHPAPAAFIDSIGTSVEKCCGRIIKDIVEHMKIDLHCENIFYEITSKQCKKVKISIIPNTETNPYHYLLFNIINEIRSELTNKQAEYLARYAWPVYDDRYSTFSPVRFTA